MKREYFVIAFVLALLASLFFLPHYLQSSPKKSISFYENFYNRSATLDEDELFFLNLVVTNDPEFRTPKILDLIKKSNPKDAYFGVFFMEPAKDPATKLKELESHDTPWKDSYSFKAAYCGELGYSKQDFDELLSQSGSDLYADPHILLALLIMKHNNCLDPETLNPAIDQFAHKLADAQAQYGDVFIERTVFLYWAGYGLLVQKPWIDQIRAHQAEDGGWKDEGIVSSPHTTGLALLALLYFDQGKNLQEMVVPIVGTR